MNSVRMICAVVCLSLAGVAAADKGASPPERTVVGNGADIKIIPDLAKATRTADGFRWSRSIYLPNASFLKAHIVDLNLRAGDSLVLRTDKGRVIETLTGRGPKDRGTFWGLSSPGDTLVVELKFRAAYDRVPFRIDQVIAGDPGLFGTGVEAGQRSICSPGDFEDVVCYDNDAAKWANVQASVGVMSVGGNPTSALFCSGSSVSPLNYMLTNQHCIETQAQCDSSEYVFRYYRTGCNDGSPTTVDWQSFRCDEIVAIEPFVSCDAGPGDLDFVLTSIIGDAVSTFGYVQPDATPLADGEGLYIIQHPAGRPHEITHGSGADVDVDGSVLRYYTTLDTEGGSSGSPIFRESDDKLVGLHHCGGCSDPGVGNRGMLMSDIVPLIEPFLCTDSLDLKPAATSAPMQVSGNGDAVIDPGETWEFTPFARNGSCATDATTVTATLDVGAGSTPVTLIDTTTSFGDLAAGQSKAGSSVRFQVGNDAICSDNVMIDLLTIDSGGASFPGAAGYLSAQVGEDATTTVFLEDFPTGLGTWTIVNGGTVTGAIDTWTTTNPGGRSLGLTPPFAIADSDNLGSGNSMDEELISPVFDTTGFSNGVTLQFTHDFTWYNGGTDEQADVEIRSSATAGAWVNLANYSGGSTSGTVSIDISAFSAADVQLRFHYYDAQWEWWWALDDITVRGSDGFSCNVSDDADGDGVSDDIDNCSLQSNADQTDSNGDGIGNACDADLTGDCAVNFGDLAALKAAFVPNPYNADADFNSDGSVNFGDLAFMKSTFFNGANPGPGPGAPGNDCELQ